MAKQEMTHAEASSVVQPPVSLMRAASACLFMHSSGPELRAEREREREREREKLSEWERLKE